MLRSRCTCRKVLQLIALNARIIEFGSRSSPCIGRAADLCPILPPLQSSFLVRKITSGIPVTRDTRMFRTRSPIVDSSWIEACKVRCSGRCERNCWSGVSRSRCSVDTSHRAASSGDAVGGVVARRLAIARRACVASIGTGSRSGARHAVRSEPAAAAGLDETQAYR